MDGGRLERAADGGVDIPADGGLEGDERLADLTEERPAGLG